MFELGPTKKASSGAKDGTHFSHLLTARPAKSNAYNNSFMAKGITH